MLDAPCRIETLPRGLERLSANFAAGDTRGRSRAVVARTADWRAEMTVQLIHARPDE
jgi:hypothetical protein